VWVKICGITRLEDALAARELGADAVGFVFTESRRKVDAALVAPWVAEVRGVEKVGVFSTEPVDDIIEICSRLGLDAAQVHAPASPAYERLAMRLGVIFALEEYAPGRLPPFACRILLDASRGRGRAGRWEDLGVPYILAGGLTPDNVGEAVRRARPFGVDVSSGVESAPGIKDPGKIERFIREARS